jgi:hypothetical protein
VSGHAKMPPASHQVSATSLKLRIQQIHLHVRVERNSGMCVARDLYELWGRSLYTRTESTSPKLAKLSFMFAESFRKPGRCTNQLNMRVCFGSASLTYLANSFASITALARSIEGACEIPPYLPRSKHVNLSYERAFGACVANQEMHIATQHTIYAANQDRENQTIAPRSPAFRRVSL